MKKHGTINSHISKILADLGHTDTIVIADVGLPVPAGVLKIDLSLRLGVPSFQDVVDMLAEDMVIEQIIVAKELATDNEETSRYINDKFKETPIDEVSHERFKLLTHNAKVVIRTGEAKPYANCILQAGVFFG